MEKIRTDTNKVKARLVNSVKNLRLNREESSDEEGMDGGKGEYKDPFPDLWDKFRNGATQRSSKPKMGYNPG